MTVQENQIKLTVYNQCRGCTSHRGAGYCDIDGFRKPIEMPKCPFRSTNFYEGEELEVKSFFFTNTTTNLTIEYCEG